MNVALAFTTLQKWPFCFPHNCEVGYMLLQRPKQMMCCMLLSILQLQPPTGY